MRLTMICVGDELLKGFTVNTNLTELGAALLEEGIVPAEAVVIPDTRESIALELERQLASETDVIVFSGGLGPTLDDLTKQVVAETLGLRLEVNDEVLTKLAEYWKRRGSGTSLPTTAENQALVPKGAEWLPNDVGTAPGLVMKVKRRSSTKTAKKPLNHQLVVLLPGPPGEFNPMVRGHLMPYFKRNLRYDAKFTKTIIVADLPESKVENLTSKLVPDNMSIAYCASPAYVRLYLSGTSKNALDEKEREIREALGVHALPSGASSPVEMLLRELRGRKMTLAVAESCTGGLIGAEITSFSGASEVFKGGFIVYSNELKMKLLDIPGELLEHVGAVSAECAEALVENLCRELDADAGIAVTGVAGPGGGTPEKPVGLVYAGIRFNGKTAVRKFQFPGDRARVRERTLHSSVNALLSMIRG